MTKRQSPGPADDPFALGLPDGQDLAFEIVAVDTFHLALGEKPYWQDFRSDDRVATNRFRLKPGWRTIYGSSFETGLVKVTLGDGSVGWGEATEPICPEVICTLAGGLLAPVLGGRRWGDPFQFRQAAYDLNRARGHHSGYLLLAIAALEVAVWDAVSKRAKLPLASVLAEKPVQKNELYVSGLRRGTIEERIALLREAVRTGFSGAKIFIDGDTPATLKELDGLRNGVPGNWALMVDALWSYDDVRSAASARESFADFKVAWFECPLISEDMDAHRQLARGGGVPIALGEHFFTHYQSEPWLQANVLDVFQPDICRTGISDGLRQTAMARRAGIRVTPHMGSGSPIVQAAALQFGAAIGADEPCEFQSDLVGLLPEVFENAWRVTGGHAMLPDAPGLGVIVDDRELESRSTARDFWRVA